MRALLIDGQQRMTTLSLLLIALADYANVHNGLAPDGTKLLFFKDDIYEAYLLHKKRSHDEERYKLTLSVEDNETYHSLIDHLGNSASPVIYGSERIISNYTYLRERLEGMANPNTVWTGVRRLQIISVSLDPEKDNPQAIFESMNSTGKDLAAADLVRNYILMGLEVEEQNELYENYWRLIEQMLGSDTVSFDNFLHDYLTLVNAPTVINMKDVYTTFKRHCTSQTIRSASDIESLLTEMLHYARIWAQITLDTESETSLSVPLERLSLLDITVVNPLLMAFYDARDAGVISSEELRKLFEIMESYLVRRAVCGCATNSLNKFFPSLIARLSTIAEDEDYLETLVASLQMQADTARRFPDDGEFKESLRTRNMYGFRKCLFVLNRLENHCHPKNPTNFFSGNYSVEHIMPQGALSNPEWVNALGGESNAAERFDSMVHRLGNLTVTSYNSELSDALFEKKKTRMVGGFGNDVIAISSGIAAKEHWSFDEIENRGAILADKAIETWGKPVASEACIAKLTKKSRRKTSGVVRAASFKSLVEQGKLVIGEVLTHSGDNGTVTARVESGGKIRLQNGELFNSPSMSAVRAVALIGGSGNTRNGWKYWTVSRDGVQVPLGSIRNSGTDDESNVGSASTEDLRRDFWNGFYEYASDLQDFCDVFGDFSLRKENAESWCSIKLGKSSAHLGACVSFSSSQCCVGIYVHFYDTKLYAKYYASRNEYATIFAPLVAKWDDIDCAKKRRTINAEMQIDVLDSDTWADSYIWIVDALWKFRRVFGNAPE